MLARRGSMSDETLRSGDKTCTKRFNQGSTREKVLFVVDPLHRAFDAECFS